MEGMEITPFFASHALALPSCKGVGVTLSLAGELWVSKTEEFC